MKKLIFTIILFAGLNQLNAQQSLQNKVDSLKFPRLWRMNWYSPANFASLYLNEIGINIGTDTDKTALLYSLRIYDMIVQSGLTTPSIADKFLILKDSVPFSFVIRQFVIRRKPKVLET